MELYRLVCLVTWGAFLVRLSACCRWATGCRAVMHLSGRRLVQLDRSVGALALLLLPSVALAHGNHASIVHLATLHVLPWISDRPYLVTLLACAYVALLWYAYRRLLARERAEEDAHREAKEE